MFITLTRPATCADCGASLPVGERARWYRDRRVFGLAGHARRAEAPSAPPPVRQPAAARQDDRALAPEVFTGETPAALVTVVPLPVAPAPRVEPAPVAPPPMRPSPRPASTWDRPRATVRPADAHDPSLDF